MQTIGVTGGTGFVGHHLTKQLVDMGYKVIIFTRDMHKVSRQDKMIYSYWSPTEKKFDVRHLKDLDAVIHLAGASVADKRWTKKRKEEVVNSRVQSTHFLIERLKEHAPKCKTLISASAIGYYGADRAGATPYHEDAQPAQDFLAHTCKLWEEEAHKAEDKMRTIILRFGIVLGKDDGAFPQLAKPQNFGVIPILGNGKQIFSWIHIEDLCNLIVWSLKEQGVKGIYNAVAPNPVSQKRLCKTIASHKRAAFLPMYVPNVVLKAVIGEGASEALKSTTVSCEKLQGEGFKFKYTDIGEAVKAILA